MGALLWLQQMGNAGSGTAIAVGPGRPAGNMLLLGVEQSSVGTTGDTYFEDYFEDYFEPAP